MFYSKHENKMYREPINNICKENQTQIPTQSEPAVSSIYNQNPLKMAEALEAIIVMLNLIQHLIKAQKQTITEINKAV